jgi:hypothetical protein
MLVFLVAGLCPFPRKSVLPDAVATQLPGCAPDLLGNFSNICSSQQKPLRDFWGPHKAELTSVFLFRIIVNIFFSVVKYDYGKSYKN